MTAEISAHVPSLLRVSGVACLVVLGVLPLGATSADGDPADAWAQAEPVAVVEDLEMPVDIAVAPDGTIWFAELAGNVSRYDPASGTTEIIHQVENVALGGERGLVGLALAHDFAENGAFYLYYSEKTDDPEGGINRLVRVVDGEERGLASLSAAIEHNGGRIVVAPDGTLFVGTGENSLHDPAQDLDSLLGKVLHMTPEGDPVDGNHKGLVYSYGHRNVYGLALDPESGELWATENSGWRRDEVNRIEAGGNYGYPECEGHGRHGIDDPCPTDKGYTFPIMTFYEDRAVAPTGAAFWNGTFHWGSLNEGSIHRLLQDPETGEWNDTVVLDHHEPVLDLHVAPDDTFYFSSYGGIWRLGLEGDADDAQADAEAPPTDGVSGNIAAPSFAFVVAVAGAAVLAVRGRRAGG